MKAAFPLAAADVGRVLAALRLPRAAARPTGYTLDEFARASWPAPAGPFAPVPVHKRRVRYTVGGCTSEVSDVVADGKPTRTHRDRVGGRGGRDRRGPLRRPRRLPQHELPDGPAGAARRRARAVRRHRCRAPTRSSSTSPSAPRPAAWTRRRRPGRGHAPGRGARGDRRASPPTRSTGPPTRDRRHGRRGAARPASVAIAAVGTAGLRIAPNGDDGRRRDPGAHRRRHRGHLGRRGEPARLPRGRRRPRARRRVARRLRHRRRQHPVHVRPRRAASTSGSASMSARCATRNASASRAPCRADVLDDARPRSPRTSRGSTAGRAPTP